MEIKHKYEKDPQYIEYLKTTKNPSYLGYQEYCFQEYRKSINEGLFKHQKRNEKLISIHMDTFLWLQEYIKNEPKNMGRSDVGGDFFNAHLKVSGCCNSLMLELSKDEIEEKWVSNYLEVIQKQKEILQNGK